MSPGEFVAAVRLGGLASALGDCTGVYGNSVDPDPCRKVIERMYNIHPLPDDYRWEADWYAGWDCYVISLYCFTPDSMKVISRCILGMDEIPRNATVSKDTDGRYP